MSSRSRGSRIITTWDMKDGDSMPVKVQVRMFDGPPTTFAAEIPSHPELVLDRFPSIEDLRQHIRQKLNDAKSITWQETLAITIEGPDWAGTKSWSFRDDTRFIEKSGDNVRNTLRLQITLWEVSHDGTHHREPGNKHARSGTPDGTLIPNTQENRNALNDIINAFKAFHLSLESLLSPTEIHNTLSLRDSITITAAAITHKSPKSPAKPRKKRA